MVGTADTPTGEDHAFLWEDGVFTDLGTLPGNTHSYAQAINDSGQVTGLSERPSEERAFLYDSINGMQNLGILPGGTWSSGFGINNAGKVVGRATDASGEIRPFVWENGVMTSLGSLGGVGAGYAYDINNADQVVGCSPPLFYLPDAFLWENGVMTDLGTLGGAYSMAMSINDAGQVAGYSQDGFSEDHAFIIDGGVMIDLGTLDGMETSRAADINEAGQIVGGAEHEVSGGEDIMVALICSGGVMTDLNEFLPDGSGWELNLASGINNAGQIVGYGTINGETRAFLLSPETDRHIPEPVSMIFFGTGLVGVLTLVRRQNARRRR